MLLRTKSTKTLTIRGENGKWTGPPAPPYIWPCSYLPKMWYMLTMLLLSNAVTTKLCIAKEPVNRLAVALEFLTISESIVRFSWAGTLARPYFWNNSERNARSPLAIRLFFVPPHLCSTNAGKTPRFLELTKRTNCVYCIIFHRAYVLYSYRSPMCNCLPGIRYRHCASACSTLLDDLNLIWRFTL